jgi:cytochrome c
MDSFEINKIIAAVLLIALIVIGIGKISDIAFHVDKPEKSAYEVDIQESTQVASSTAKKIEEKVDISALLALGDVSHGEKVFKKCSACHLVNKGGENKIGPALYGVIGRKVASKKDYKYSKAMAAYDKNWTFEEMNGYLKKPQSYIKGTKMAFAGLRKEKDRASVILYLNQNSDNPLPLP